MSAFKGHDTFFVTYDSTRTRHFNGKKYLIPNIGIKPHLMISAFFEFIHIFIIERPDVIISTGSEIAIPVFIVSKLFGSITIFIESWCRVFSASRTGKIVYPLSDLFLVQWPNLLNVYGKKARYEGAII
jgi:UDP-N-acetylglucosamine:LPS N-acetylglucosamine transferase